MERVRNIPGSESKLKWTHFCLLSDPDSVVRSCRSAELKYLTRGDASAERQDKETSSYPIPVSVFALTISIQVTGHCL